MISHLMSVYEINQFLMHFYFTGDQENTFSHENYELEDKATNYSKHGNIHAK